MLSVIISILALMVALASLGVSLGMKWSSHKIEFKPIEIQDPFKDDNFQPFTEPTEELVDEALKLSKQGLERKKKKQEEKDPMDEILESNNF